MTFDMDDLNEQQQRALWATAFRDLATAMQVGACPIPTRVEMWNQWVDVHTLMIQADACPEVQPIRRYGKDNTEYASTTIPTGKPLGLDLVWKFQCHENIATHAAAIDEHNVMCVEKAADA